MKPSYTVLVVLLVVVIFLTFESHGWRRRRRRRRAPPAIHCATSPWMQWSGCSLTCGGGVSTRTRTVIRHPQHGGRGCPHLTDTRRCYTQPCPVPVTCKWGNWGTWSPCDPCFPGGRSRARNITTPAMFGGAQCPGTRALSDYFCTTQKTCIVRTCPRNMFSCLDGLGCISKRLRCNGDGDCSDFSDEDDCSRTQSPCRRTYVGIPNIDIAGSGYDITKLREEGRLLDNDKYNGRCMTVRSGELGQRFRSPANIQSYRFQVRVDTAFAVKSYESSRDYFLDERSTYQRKLDASASYSYKDIFSLSAKSSGSNSQNTKLIIDYGTNSDSKFFRVTSKIQVATFKMIRRSFILSYQFQLRLKELPDDFDYTKYAEVISDFGSHYYSSGVLGGKYEYVYRYSKSALRSSGLSNVDQQNCLRQEASTSFLGFGGSAARSKCSTNFLSIKNKGSFTRSATNAVSNVIGGSSDKAAALSFFASKSPNQANYNEWVKTVKNNPAVIDYMLSPISAAVPFSMPHKRRNMERALVYYLQEYNFSKCKGKCANNGAVVVTNNGKLCKCLCASGFGGIDCNVRA